MDAKKLADQAVKEERALIKLERDFALASPEFAKFLKKQKETQDKVDKMWAAVKDALVKAEFTDVLENKNFKISITKVINPKVVDIDKVPEVFVETKKVANIDKIKKYVELYGNFPIGTEDGSFYRLNKKIKEV